MLIALVIMGIVALALYSVRSASEIYSDFKWQFIDVPAYKKKNAAMAWRGAKAQPASPAGSGTPAA